MPSGGRKGRWLRRTRPELREEPTTAPEPEHVAAAAAIEPEPLEAVEVVEVVEAPTPELVAPVVLEPTWSETEEQWRRLIANAGRSGAEIAPDESPASAAEVIVYSLTCPPRRRHTALRQFAGR